MRDEIRTTIKTLRKGDELKIRRLTDLGRSLVEVLAIISEVHSKGAIVVETTTGRRSDRDAVEMIRGGLRYLRKGKTQRQAKADGGKGGRPRADREMPDDKAEIEWRSLKHSIDADAIEHMPGWNRSAAIRRFGPSGRPEGRRKIKPAVVKRKPK